MKVAVLISGRGSNLKSIIDDSRIKGCPYTISTVMSDKICAGLFHAEQCNIPTYVIEYLPKKPKQFAEETIDLILRLHGIDLVVLAGYMRIISPFLVDKWDKKIINIHPSLLPNFPGLDTHKRAIESGVELHGCTVHYVDQGMDTGPIIEQQTVPVLPTDTPETLASRVLKEEHILLPRVIRNIALKNNL